jgi:hypothetical protein
MAQSGHKVVHCTCPLLGAKRTWPFALHMSAFDPKRTLAGGQTYMLVPKADAGALIDTLRRQS